MYLQEFIKHLETLKVYQKVTKQIAIKALKNFLEFEGNKKINDIDLDNLIDCAKDNDLLELIYNDDCFNFLQENNITNFHDAIRENGFNCGIMEIANYYLFFEKYLHDFLQEEIRRI